MALRLKLKELRKAHPNKPRQQDMADYLGLSLTNYNQMEKLPTKSIQYDVLEKLCLYFNCTLNDLFETEFQPASTEVKPELNNGLKTTLSQDLKLALAA